MRKVDTETSIRQKENLMPQGERKPDVEDVRRFLSQGEGYTVEFKTQLRDPALMARLIASFANALGGSILIGISGIKDIRGPGAVVGASVAAVAKTLDEARKHLYPSVPAFLHEVDLDGKPVAIVQVPPSDTPVASDGSFFVRSGAAGRVMAGHGVHRMVPLSFGPVRPAGSWQAMAPDDLLRKLSESAKTFDLADLALAISKQTTIIEGLEMQLLKVNSLRSKLQDYIVGGAIGALLGFLFSMLLR